MSTATDSQSTLITDSDWAIQGMGAVPEKGQFRVRCNTEGDCWLWSNRSVWILRSTAQWHQVYAIDGDDRQSIGGVFFLSALVGWVTRPGALYQTKDGGTTWTRINIMENMNPSDLHFRDEQMGWIVGSRYRPLVKGDPMVNNAMSRDLKSIIAGVILRTSDGGTTWQAHNMNSTIHGFDTVTFRNNTGVTLGPIGCFVTQDGGRQWTEILRKFRDDDTGEVPEPTSAFLLDEKRGWITLGGAEIIATQDGGKSWHFIKDPKATPDTLAEISFVDSINGLALSHDLGGGKLFKTLDGGKTWLEIVTYDRFQSISLQGKERGILLSKESIYSIRKR